MVTFGGRATAEAITTNTAIAAKTRLAARERRKRFTVGSREDGGTAKDGLPHQLRGAAAWAAALPSSQPSQGRQSAAGRGHRQAGWLGEFEAHDIDIRDIPPASRAFESEVGVDKPKLDLLARRQATQQGLAGNELAACEAG